MTRQSRGVNTPKPTAECVRVSRAVHGLFRFSAREGGLLEGRTPLRSTHESHNSLSALVDVRDARSLDPPLDQLENCLSPTVWEKEAGVRTQPWVGMVSEWAQRELFE